MSRSLRASRSQSSSLLSVSIILDGLRPHQTGVFIVVGLASNQRTTPVVADGVKLGIQPAFGASSGVGNIPL